MYSEYDDHGGSSFIASCCTICYCFIFYFVFTFAIYKACDVKEWKYLVVVALFVLSCTCGYCLFRLNESYWKYHQKRIAQCRDKIETEFREFKNGKDRYYSSLPFAYQFDYILCHWTKQFDNFDLGYHVEELIYDYSNFNL